MIMKSLQFSPKYTVRVGGERSHKKQTYKYVCMGLSTTTKEHKRYRGRAFTEPCDYYVVKKEKLSDICALGFKMKHKKNDPYMHVYLYMHSPS